MKNQVPAPGTALVNTQTIQDWLREKIAQEASLDIKAVDLDTDFSNFNLDSLSVVSLAYELETFTGTAIDPTVFSEFRTPNELVQWLQLQQR